MPFLTAVHLFFVFVLGQGLFLTITFLTLKKGDRTSNKLLAAVVFCMTYYTFNFLLHDTGFRRYFPILLINGYSLSPIIPVLFYLYLKQATEKKLSARTFLHFIPFVVQFLYWLPNNASGLFHTLSKDARGTYYSESIVNGVALIHVMIFLVYNYLSFCNIKLSTRQPHKTRWLKRVRLLYTLLAAIFTTGTLMIMFLNAIEVRYVFFPFMAFFIYTIGYYGYLKSEVIFDNEERPSKYRHSRLSPIASQNLYQQLLDKMEADHPFLNPDLKLAELAQQLGTNAHHLSQSINENSGKGFLDFINQYRVEVAKRIIRNDLDNHYKMLAVALDSGFNNKVSFYRYFKKVTGYLPAAYKASLCQKQSTDSIKV